MAWRRGHQPAGHNQSPLNAADVEQLRWQVEFLTQLLAQLEIPAPVEEDEESDTEFIYPFHHHVPRLQRMVSNNQRSDLNIKIYIPKFMGSLEAEEFIDWLNNVERIF